LAFLGDDGDGVGRGRSLRFEETMERSRRREERTMGRVEGGQLLALLFGEKRCLVEAEVIVRQQGSEEAQVVVLGPGAIVGIECDLVEIEIQTVAAGGGEVADLEVQAVERVAAV